MTTLLTKLDETTGEIRIDLRYYLEEMEMDELEKMDSVWRGLAMTAIRDMLKDTRASKTYNRPLYELRQRLLQDEEIVGELAARTVQNMVMHIEELAAELEDYKGQVRKLTRMYREATDEYPDIERVESQFHSTPWNELHTSILFEIIDGSLYEHASEKMDVCPYCGSKEAEQTDVEFMDGFVQEEVVCLKCGSEYIQGYYLMVTDKIRAPDKEKV